MCFRAGVLSFICTGHGRCLMHQCLTSRELIKWSKRDSQKAQDLICAYGCGFPMLNYPTAGSYRQIKPMSQHIHSYVRLDVNDSSTRHLCHQCAKKKRVAARVCRPCPESSYGKERKAFVCKKCWKGIYYYYNVQQRI